MASFFPDRKRHASNDQHGILEYDVVRLKRDIGASKGGWQGTALLMHGNPAVACEVEFADDHGNTLTIETVQLEDLDFVLRPSQHETT